MGCGSSTAAAAQKPSSEPAQPEQQQLEQPEQPEHEDLDPLEALKDKIDEKFDFIVIKGDFCETKWILFLEILRILIKLRMFSFWLN